MENINLKVRGTIYKPGDMSTAAMKQVLPGMKANIDPNGKTYEVKESLGKGAYKLKDCKGNEMPRTWNICNLKKCYIHEL
ncbi:hypothetical protein Tco_0565380 [Tanacetum coccineum]